MIGSDYAALLASAREDMGLCTLVGLDGSFSRRIGAQLAVAPDGRTFGSLSDGCLEQQLASDTNDLRQSGAGPAVVRYGRGSPIIDFRLPCGGRLDILIDPSPDRARIRQAADRLQVRQTAMLDLPVPVGTNEALLQQRRFIPPLRILIFGEGPEFHAFSALATTAGAIVEGHARSTATSSGLTLGQMPQGLVADPWTAVLLLFHDHEWEAPLIRWALGTPAFFIGAQGGAPARAGRLAMLRDEGVSQPELDRLRSPIGLIPRARDPETLALSVLAQIVNDYQHLHPHP